MTAVPRLWNNRQDCTRCKVCFWNENDTDKYYVNGCSFSEVSSNKVELLARDVIFTFDNDMMLLMI